MPAFLEPVAFVLRVGREATEYGKPYTASGTVVDLGDGVCEVRGFTRLPDNGMSQYEICRDVVACLKRAGFTKWKWDRRRNDGVHHTRITEL